jgi:hypothetical protein
VPCHGGRWLTQTHAARRRLASWRLDPPSNAIALRVLAIPVRWFDRMHVRRISRTQPLSGDISRTNQTRAGFDMRAFCRSLKGGSTTLSVTGRSRGGRGDDAALCSSIRFAAQIYSIPQVFLKKTTRLGAPLKSDPIQKLIIGKLGPAMSVRGQNAKLPGDSAHVCFSPKGRHLSFVSARNGLAAGASLGRRSLKLNLLPSPRQVARPARKVCAILHHVTRIAACTSQMRSTIFIDRASNTPMCKVWVHPTVTNVNQIGRP